MRPALRRLAFSLVPLAVALGLAEALARAFPPPEEAVQAEQDYLLPPHPTRIWAPRPGAVLGGGPNAVRIGPDGLRALPGPEAELRILTLGDSNIFGHGLADGDTLQVRLERALAARGLSVDVICGGVPGYSSEQSRALLDEQGWALEPDLLIVANLLSDSTQERFTDREWMRTLGGAAPRLDQRLLASSAAWSWLRRSLTHETRIERRITWVRPPTLVARRRVPVQDYAENLDAMVVSAAERGVGALLFQLATEDRLAGRLDAPEYVEAQRALAARRGLPIVDAVDVLRAEGLEGQRAFIDPVHASPQANAAYAEAIARALVEAGWPRESLLAR